MKWAGFLIWEEELCKLFKALHDQIQLPSYYSLPGQLNETASKSALPPLVSTCPNSILKTELLQSSFSNASHLSQLTLTQEAGL